MNRRTFLARGGAAAGLIARAWAARIDSDNPVAQTTAGKIRGTVQGKVKAFKGIPYGASTEGAGRFMPPSKPQPWTGVRDALELGPASPQTPSMLIPESMAQQPKNDGAGSEDSPSPERLDTRARQRQTPRYGVVPRRRIFGGLR